MIKFYILVDLELDKSKMGRVMSFCNFHISNNMIREFLAEYLG